MSAISIRANKLFLNHPKPIIIDDRPKAIQNSNPHTSPIRTGRFPPTILVFWYPVDNVVIPRVTRSGKMSIVVILPGVHVGPWERSEPMKRNGESEASIPNTAALVIVSKYTFIL